MIDDPIVKEVRRARQELFEEYGCDLGRLVAALKEMEKQDPRPKVTYPPKRLQRTGAET